LTPAESAPAYHHGRVLPDDFDSLPEKSDKGDRGHLRLDLAAPNEYLVPDVEARIERVDAERRWQIFRIIASSQARTTRIG